MKKIFNQFSNKERTLFLILSGVFITNALIAELIGIKIFSLEQSLGLNPAEIELFGNNVLNFNLTAGVAIWPIVFITTDVINEYFGKKGVQFITFFAIACIIYAFIAIGIVIDLSPAQFWIDVNAGNNNFNIDEAFGKIYGQSLNIIIASVVAFAVSQLLDVIVFQRLRKITGPKMIWLRATGSTLVSQLIDSYIVLIIAFYLLQPEETRWSIAQVISVGVINYIYKFIVAVVLTPLLYFVHAIIDKYLGKEKADQLAERAMVSS